ncbi:MAG: 5-formyltetrahydrofolate cyclo-ligase, partial [Candidatus Heimdallarchaeota archaeon]
PGVAFDLRGHRLGYGKGYYDRLLREVSSLGRGALFIGLAYEFQVLDKIPHGSDDVPVHKIVTEKRVINVC